jgi:Histidine kinase-, DNA gyrase B-, and HSP90-like ATPase
MSVNEDNTYKMRISLNVLNHLGINLYSSTPAVLSEVVANAWDADAKEVDITIMDDSIVISDNGIGMSVVDMNDKYLNVGYQKRVIEGDTSDGGRHLMGRKGIGKLSLFSIANIIKVESMKDGEIHGLVMSADKIKDTIKDDKNHDYNPDKINTDELTINKSIGTFNITEHGTRITISDLKKGLQRTKNALKKRIARRFSIIGADHDFIVRINTEEITVEDRNYFHKIECMWFLGDKSVNYLTLCKEDKLIYSDLRSNEVKVSFENHKLEKETNTYELQGWIGTVAHSGDLKDEYDNLNKITILVRGRLAQEDILEDFTEGGLFTKYLIGEIHADFLDITGEDESATSNRQEIKKDDPRYIALREFIKGELKQIKNKWTDIRKGKGEEEATQIPAINDWYSTLIRDDKVHAKTLFGKIGQLKIEDDSERRELYKQSVLAFENMKYKRKLEALESISVDRIVEFTALTADLDEIEATLYYQIIKERLTVIEKLHHHVEENALEKILQKYLYEHLWLLDPSWDRATETPQMEERFSTLVKNLDSHGLTKDELDSRFDIKYKKSSGKHIIIELKRSEVLTNRHDLGKQVDKYKRAFEKILLASNIENEPIEVICIVGKPLADWDNPKNKEMSIRSMAESKVRVVLYRELIEDAYNSYQTFLEKNKEAGRLSTLLERIELEEYE